MLLGSPPPKIKTNGLVQQVCQELSERVRSGVWKLGERLPSEQALAEEFGVSRTVVREAVARLKSEGLLDTRQGAGVFVARSMLGVPFRIDPASVDSRAEVATLFELRLGIEAEAAALAALRGTKAQKRAITEAMRASEATEGGVAEDLAFHRAIVLAANNRHFERLGEFLERYIEAGLRVTRQRTRRAGRTAEVHSEHRAIEAAILAGDPDRARDAARRHIQNGIKRLSSIRDD